MLDQFHRNINYIRISLTDRCNLSCKYCRPYFQGNLSHDEILSYEELLRFCHVAVQLGISKFKITGGEPLLRKDCLSFIGNLKKLGGVEQVTLTTNGTMLGKYVQELKAIGIDGVNISIDSCNPKTYADITGSDCLKEVLAAFEEAYIAGLPLKINCVPLQGMGVEEILALLNLVKDNNNFYCLKQIHHEPCDYYNFSNKMESELNDYQKIIKIGICIPKMIDYDIEKEIIIKEYIDGYNAMELVENGKMNKKFIKKMLEIEKKCCEFNLNIDYYPTNFIITGDEIYYIDFECNFYDEKWSFSNWGIKYWEK